MNGILKMASPRAERARLFKHNPVAQAELRHQRYVITSSRSGRMWIVLALVMLIPALLGSFYFLVAGLTGPIDVTQLINNLRGVGFVMMITMNMALYMVVILITLGLSANSIQREKNGKTWDTLLLTNIDARRIVWGKWWASLRAMWGDHLMVGLLRLGLVGWLVGVFSPILPDGIFGLAPGWAYIPPLVIITTLFTVVDAMFTAGLGVAVPLSNWSGSVTGGVVLTARLAAMAAWVWLYYFAAEQIRFSGGLHFVVPLLAGLIVYLIATWGVLRVAQMIAVRGEVSPPGSDE